MRKVSMKDIAEKCGVGRSTVSFILNGTASRVGISEKLKERVLVTAKEMGYKPNDLASAVRSGKSKTIAIVTPQMASSYTMRFIAGVNDCILQGGYSLRLFVVKKDESWDDVAGRFVSSMIAGVIPQHEGDFLELYERLQPYRIPFSLPFFADFPFPVNQSCTDDFAGAKLAADELFKLGHRRLGLVYVEKVKGFRFKQEGFLTRLRELGLDSGPEVRLALSSNGDWNQEDAERVREFFNRPDRPSAVFCESDPLALRFIQYADQAGYRVPRDISVIGYANLDYAVFSNPPLSTFDTPFEEIGYKTAETLLNDIENQTNGCVKNVINVRYIERQSTKTYRKEG